MAKFQKGQSGNMRGRPKGIADRRVRARELFARHADELVGIAIQKARDGDMAALRLCIERICPPIKAVSERVTIESLPESLVERAELIFARAASGAIATETATELLSAIAVQVRIVEVCELERRIVALESGALSNPTKTHF